jgi:hypothetical protein
MLEMRSRLKWESKHPQAMSVVPRANEHEPNPLMRFFAKPFLSPSQKLYNEEKNVKRIQEIKVAVPKYDESIAQKGMLIQRKMMAFRNGIRPAGMGLQGLFSTSSSSNTVWLMRLNCKSTNQSQTTALKVFSTGDDRQIGAVPIAKMVCTQSFSINFRDLSKQSLQWERGSSLYPTA